jgi:hypothetical protein
VRYRRETDAVAVVLLVLAAALAVGVLTQGHVLPIEREASLDLKPPVADRSSDHQRLITQCVVVHEANVCHPQPFRDEWHRRWPDAAGQLPRVEHLVVDLVGGHGDPCAGRWAP